jgi:hypothetical protein
MPLIAGERLGSKLQLIKLPSFQKRTKTPQQVRP